MVNAEKFAERLEKILNHYELSAAAFADTIEVGRSSISHILSGRNKPSLDFVMKIITHFPEVELYWLLNGKGKFPKDSPIARQKLSAAAPSPAPVQATKNPALEQAPLAPASEGKQIKKIVIFYTDGTFEAFEN